MGHPSPTRRRNDPVKFAVIRCTLLGSFPASYAITASTANSGSVCSHARIASASPCEIRNCAASAAQAITIAAAITDGNVQRAEIADAPGVIVSAAGTALMINLFNNASTPQKSAGLYHHAQFSEHR